MLDKLKGIKGLPFILVGLAAGVLCLIMSGSSDAGSGTAAAAEENKTVTLAQYADEEEKRVCALLNAIDGVRSSRVMLTFESGSEYVYDSSGFSQKAPLLLEEHPPKVSGAAVVCVGGDNAEIQMKIINLICSLYGITSSRVSVAGAS